MARENLTFWGSVEPAEGFSYIFLIHTLLERGKEPDRGVRGQCLPLPDRGEVKMFPDDLLGDGVREAAATLRSQNQRCTVG